MTTIDTPAPELPWRPRLAGDVLVHPPAEDGAPWLLERDGRRYFRVGADLARLAQLLTGQHDRRELALLLGAPWTDPQLEAALRQMQGLGLLDDGEARVTRRSRVAVVPPFSLQFTVLDPSRLLDRLARTIDRLGARPALLAYLVVALAGLAALALRAGDVLRLVSQPVPVLVFATIFAGNFLATVVHELAHGAVLTRFGGKPRRMGFMLFYLVPAFFCDVSDGWRLPRPAMRVRVALAGIAAQFVIAGAAALLALLLPASTVRDSLLLLSVVVYVAGSVNIVPFVKFDGYLALMSHLDISDLRGKAMADARAALAERLYGARLDRELPGRRWVVPYGLACLAFPLLLVGVVALALWSEIFARMGYVGEMVNLSLVLLVVCGVVREAVRVHRLAVTGAGSLPRTLAVDALLVAVAAGLLTQVHHDRTVPAGYVVDRDGAHLYVASAGDAELVAPGDTVELRDNGLLRRPRTGAARIGAAPADRAEISMTRFTPLDVDLDLGTGVVRIPLEVTAQPERAEGVARVHVGEQTLGGWLVDSLVSPFH